MKSIRATLALAGLAILTGCDIPTEAPILEQRWILPADNSTISVTELLPSGVTVSGNNFAVSVGAFNTNKSLGDLCTTCSALNGLTAPVPPFNGSLTLSQTLPANVQQATVVSGSALIAIQNGFSFDPLAGGGSLTVTVYDGQGGKQVGQTVFSAPLAAGTTVTRTLTLAAGSLGATLYVDAALSSPGGQLSTIDTNQRLTITATPSPILVSAARVNVANRSVTVAPMDLDVSDIDSAITDRIQSGNIILDVTNPFGVAVSAQLDINYPGGKITKAFNVGSGATSTNTLAYTGDELRAFLGKSGVSMTGSGSVSSSAGYINITPGQQVLIKAKIDLTLRIGD
ncbi:MAG: hypothetical protein ACYC6F_05970 [Longimicrobiales bacterium]